MSPEPSPFERWLDDFLAAYHARRPVNATFIGVHTHDARLPDLSENGAGDTVAGMEDLRARLDALPREGRTQAQDLDARLARGFLEIDLAEMRSDHVHRGNPAVYTGEAAFGVIGLFLTEYAPLDVRVEAAVGRLEAVPDFLATARDNVRAAPRAWTERALAECDGLEALLARGLPRLAAERGIAHGAFLRAAERAAAAVEEHRSALADLPAREDGYAGGEAMLDGVMRHGHFLDETPAALAERAEAELAEAEGRLAGGARALGAASPAHALARLQDHHPTAEGYLARYGEVWEAVKARAEALGLLTWPDFPIRYVPRPGWVREAAEHLYFLYYRSPAAHDRPPVHDYLVTPVEPSMPAEEQGRRLRANHDAAIKLNHVVHHGGLGHHVQNWHAFRAPSRIGRIAAVDCASRIAMTCGGTMAEGWACYATDLADEAGLLTPLEQYAEIHSRVRMCARAVVDVWLHTGRLAFDDAVAFYRDRAGMPEGAARAEAVKNSMFPGGALMYMAGTDAIHALRAELTRRRGAAFDLGAFHDAFLAHGSVPVTLVAQAMLAEEGAGRAGRTGEATPAAPAGEGVA